MMNSFGLKTESKVPWELGYKWALNIRCGRTIRSRWSSGEILWLDQGLVQLGVLPFMSIRTA